MSDVEKLNNKVDKAIEKLSDFKNKPYLIKSKDLSKSITIALEDVFHENKKINLMCAILIIGIIGLMLMGFILWTLWFSVPLQ
jgi:hypothetical protein